ncbi:MAG: ABC transporter permease [Anaerolineae bacterium]|jgi:ABC-2 type transport system permease protein
MRNIWLVIKHDVIVTLRQPSFWVITLLMPAIFIGMNAYAFIQGNGPSDAGNGGETSQEGLPLMGLVDEAGLAAEFPEGMPQDLFQRFPDEEAAAAALEAGTIEQYTVIPADYLATGDLEVYAREFSLLGQEPSESVGQQRLGFVIKYNLTGDAQLVTALGNPTPGSLAQYHALAPQEGAQGGALAQMVATVLPLAYYFLLLMGSSYLMRSVVTEKENRTAEVLLVSLDPRSMMVGKILAMSAVTLIQVAVWLISGMVALDRGSALLEGAATFAFPPGFALWAVLFLVLGFLLFASIMAAAGAISNSAREANQIIWLLVLPQMPTLMFATQFLEAPHGTLALVLSLFPLSAPTAMVTRLAVAQVPLWQILVSLAGLAVVAYLFIWLAARFFRAGNLLSQESFNWQRLATAWQNGE